MKEALKLALEWAESHGEIVFAGGGMGAVTGMNAWAVAVKEALAQPEQEPVAELAGVAYVDDLDLWHFYPLRETDNFPDGTKFYTAPPKRPWVGLTAQEAADCWTTSATKTWHNFEAALRSKNI